MVGSFIKNIVINISLNQDGGQRPSLSVLALVQI